MKILRTKGAVELADGIRLLPFARYVLPDGVADAVRSELVAQLNSGECGVTVSHFNSHVRHYAGQDLAGNALMIYRHAAFGDTLIATALVAYLRHRFPDAIIDVYTAPANIELWKDCGARVYGGFPLYDAASQYDFHLLFEYMLEGNSEPDQRNCYDDMYQYAGFEPSTIPVAFKRPAYRLAKPPTKGTHIVYHLWASNPNRCYPPDQANNLLNELQTTYPNREIMLVGKDDHGFFKRYPKWKAHHIETPSIGACAAVVASAALVICPDSAIGHLAAAFPEVPVISLWGLFHPDDRVKYYPNHHPIGAFSACPHAPCRVHTFHLPQQWCKDASNATPGAAQYCNVLRAILPDAIMAKAKDLLGVEARHIGKPKFLVLTATNSKGREVHELTHPLNRAYCDAHQIDYAVESIPDDDNLHPSWAKIGIIQRFLEEYEYVLWIDTDAAFVGASDIRHALKEATLNIAVDHNGVNCGVMVWRSCDEAKQALGRMRGACDRFRDHKWFEQAALMEFVDELDVHYVDKPILNAYAEDASPMTIIRHWPGMEHTERLSAIRSYVKGRELTR